MDRLFSSLVEIDIDTNRTLLNRYRYVEHEVMRILAGWLPRIASFELKCEAARSIWENSHHVNGLYLRLREVQSPAFQKPADTALVHLLQELRHAPDEVALMHAYAGVMLPSLVAAMEEHESATFPNSDLPSVYILAHTILDLRGQLARLRSLLPAAREGNPEAGNVREWTDYVGQLLRAAGGIGGRGDRREGLPQAPACRSELTVSREARRDSRFTNPGADQQHMPSEDDPAHTEEEFERYSTEMLAAETVATVMYQLSEMPWEFEYDSARHLFDEVRHCLMGYEWMRRHGMNPFDSPQYLNIFAWRAQFPPVMQYCLLTMGNEVHAFPYRHRRVEAHRASGDRLSEQFVRYDIADETQHVRFGKRWLPELLKRTGETRPLEQYVADVLEVWKSQYSTGKLPIGVE